MTGAKKNFVLSEGIVPKKSPPPTDRQEAGRLATSKKMSDTRFSPQRRGKHEVGTGALHRKGFKK